MTSVALVVYAAHVARERRKQENNSQNSLFGGSKAVTLPAKWPLVSKCMGTDVNSALVKAADSGDAVEVKKYLDTKRANANFQDKDGWTPLMFAAMKGHTEVVETLLRAGSVKWWRSAQWETLHMAADQGHVKVVQALLAADGINVNRQNMDGYAPLHLAARLGRTKVVEVLLAVDGIVVNTRQEDGWTPLMYAARHGHTQVVEALLGAQGIEVNPKNRDGWTPLAAAACQGHTEVVKVLLDAEGIDVNLKTMKGGTPLHTAASEGHTEVVKVLLCADSIDINLQDKDGMTPLASAAKHGHTEVMKAFLGTGDVDTLHNQVPRASVPSTSDRANQRTAQAPTGSSHQQVPRAASVVHRAVQAGPAAACGRERLQLVGEGALKAERLMQLLRTPEAAELKAGSSTLTTILGNACMAFPHELSKAAGEVILFLDSCYTANEYCKWKVSRVVGRLKALQPVLTALKDALTAPSLDVDEAMVASLADTLMCLLQVLVELVVLICDLMKMRQNQQQFLKRAAAFLGSQGHKCELDAVDTELQSCLSQLTALLRIHQFTSEAAVAMVKYQDQAISGDEEDDKARRQDLKDLAGSLLRMEGGVEELRNQLRDQSTSLLQVEAWLREVHTSSIEMQLHLPRIEEKLDYAIQLLIRQDSRPLPDQQQKQRPAFIIAREEIVVPQASLRSGVAGGYGTVLKAERDGRAVALKIYNYQTAAASHSLKEQEAFVMEAYILQQASHHNIVRCYGVLYDPLGRPGQSLQGSLVMEWVNGGNLFQWLQGNAAAVSLRQRVALAAQVAAGMKHIHGLKIRHGDLKPENVLVSEVDGGQEAKICDFGLAAYNTTLGTKKMQASRGTIAYLSPERLATHTSGPSYEDDVYAFGMVLHVIITSTRPYPLTQGDIVTQVNVASGKLRPNIDAALLSHSQPNDVSCIQGYIALAKRCWHQTAAERPPFPEIYNSLTGILDQIGTAS